MPVNRPLVFETMFGQEGNENYSSNNPLNLGKNIMGAGLIGAPIAAGVFVGAKRIKSNEYSRIAGLKTNVLGDASATVGNNLRNLRNIQDDLSRRKAERLRKNLSDDTFIKKLEGASQESRRRILTGVLDSFKSVESSEEGIQLLKNSIVEILERESVNVDDQMKGLLRNAFRTVKDSNPNFYEKLGRDINFYKSVETQLTSPLEYTGIKANYKVLDISDLGAVAKGRFDEIRSILGNNKFDIQAVLFDEKLGTKSTGMSKTGMKRGSAYAKISSGKRFTMIPIDISNTIESIGSPVVRLGHGMQAYTAPMVVGLGDKIKTDYLDLGKSFTADDISSSLMNTKGGSNRAFVTIEDAFINVLRKNVEKNQGQFYSGHFKDYNKQMVSILENLNRVTSDKGETMHAVGRSRATASKMTIILDGIDEGYRRDFSANAISRAGMDTISGHTNLKVSSVNDLTTVNVALKDGISIRYKESHKDFIAKGVEGELKLTNRYITPAILPLTARPKQYFNLENRVIGRGQGNKSKNMMLVMDMVGNKRLGLSEGEMYLGANFFTRKSFPKTVYDPKEMSSGGSALLKELIRRKNEGSGPLVIRPGENVNIGKEKVFVESMDNFYKKFGSKEGGGLFLGRLDDKLVEIPHYRGIKNLSLEIIEKTTDTGASLLRLSGFADLDDKFPKVFSEFAKSTVVDLDKTTLQQMDARYDLEKILPGFTLDKKQKDTKRLIDRRKGVKGIAGSFGMVEGSMLKKSAYYHNLQMASAAQVFSQRRGLIGSEVFDAIRGRQDQLIAEGLTGEFIDEATTAQKQRYTKSMVQSISEFMSGSTVGGVAATKEFTDLSRAFVQAGQATPEEIGRVFGAFHEAIGDSGKMYSGLNGQEVEGIIRSAFKDDQFVKSSRDEIQKGLALALTEVRTGPDLATQRANQASMEARMFNFLGYRLNRMGMDRDEISNVLFGLMARKTNAGGELVALKEFMQFHQVAKGLDSVLDAKTYSNLERVSLDTFVDKGLTDESLSKFLREREGGFLLDFGDKTTAASKALSQRYKGRDALYIPAGEDFMRSISGQGTEIMKLDKTIKLSSEYVRNLQIFSKSLSEFMNPNESTGEEVRRAGNQIKNFETAFANISGTAYKGLLKGKLEGSSSPRAAGMKLSPMAEKEMMSAVMGDELARKMGRDTGVDFMGKEFKGRMDMSAAQKSRMEKAMGFAMSQTKSMVAFGETQAFLASMSDYISGATKEHVASGLSQGKAERVATREAGQKFQAFFLGGYEDYARNKDVSMLRSIVTRHPQLGIGHVQEAVLMRYGKEVKSGGDIDLYLNRVLKTETGSRLFAEMQSAFAAKGISISEANFESLAKAGAANLEGAQQKTMSRFFEFMATNISRYQMGQGAGRIFFPDMEVDVHYGQDKKRRINLSLASAAIGDADGDLFQLIMPSRAGTKSISEAIGKGNYKAVVDEMFYRSSLRMIFDEAGVGLKNMENILGSESQEASDLLRGQIMKEIIHKDVGRLDTALDSIRMGMVHGDFRPGQMKHVQQAFGLLVALEEVGTIKAKKLPIPVDIGKAITSATKSLYETGDSSRLRKIVDLVMPGLSEGIGKVRGVDMSAIGSKEVRGIIEKSFEGMMGKDIINMEEIFKVYETAADVSRTKLGAAYTKTIPGLASIFTSEKQTRAKMQAQIAATQTSVQARMMGETEETAMRKANTVLQEGLSRIKSASNIFNAKMLGPSIAGIVGSLAVFGALTSSGRNPEPLIMPGEITDKGLNARIEQGGLFDNQSRARTPSDQYVRESDGLDIMSRPINTGETRVDRPSGYTIRGEVPNRASMESVQRFMKNIGGDSSFVVNDTRGPITMNYINRIRNE